MTKLGSLVAVFPLAGPSEVHVLVAFGLVVVVMAAGLGVAVYLYLGPLATALYGFALALMLAEDLVQQAILKRAINRKEQDREAVPCRSCGYDLRGNPTAEVRSECGSKVSGRR